MPLPPISQAAYTLPRKGFLPGMANNYTSTAGSQRFGHRAAYEHEHEPLVPDEPLQQALQQGALSVRKNMLANFGLSALLTWLPLPFIHVAPAAGLAVFGLTSLSSFLRGALGAGFRWLSPLWWIKRQQENKTSR